MISKKATDIPIYLSSLIPISTPPFCLRIGKAVQKVESNRHCRMIIELSVRNKFQHRVDKIDKIENKDQKTTKVIIIVKACVIVASVMTKLIEHVSQLIGQSIVLLCRQISNFIKTNCHTFCHAFFQLFHLNGLIINCMFHRKKLVLNRIFINVIILILGLLLLNPASHMCV